MKTLRSGLLSLSLFALGLCFSAPALAQAQTTVRVTPDAVTVTGTRGQATPETRTLAVRATAPVTNLRIDAFDLYNSDRDRVFPKRLITLPSTLPQVNVAHLESLPVTFNLQEAPSGEFRGDILVSYQGNELSVPVIIRVKDPWYLPFALLAFGVILGTTVSSYSRWGRTTDEITVSLESLRTQLERDQDIPPAFKSRITTHLVDAKLARDAKQLEAARQSITAARALWNQWFRQRTEWLETLNVGRSLEENLATLPPPDQTRYLQTIQRDLKQALTQVANFATPSELAQQINRLSRQQAFYRRVSHQLLTLQKNLEDFKAKPLEASDREQLQVLNTTATRLQQQLTILSPTDQPEQAELREIEDGIVQAIADFETFKSTVADTSLLGDLGEFKRGEGKSVNAEPPSNEPEAAIAPPPEIPAFPADENPVVKGISALIPNPTRRLQLFSFAGYLTTIAFLAGTGFNQLYLERPTFGADGLRDYFALLAWGFGAEATRSAVTNALRRTDESKP